MKPEQKRAKLCQDKTYHLERIEHLTAKDAQIIEKLPQCQVCGANIFEQWFLKSGDQTLIVGKECGRDLLSNANLTEADLLSKQLNKDMKGVNNFIKLQPLVDMAYELLALPTIDTTFAPSDHGEPTAPDRQRVVFHLTKIWEGKYNAGWVTLFNKIRARHNLSQMDWWTFEKLHPTKL